MNLAFKHPIVFWDTANLIVDSGAMNLEQEFEKDIEDEEDENEDTKIKNSSTDYGRIAAAIGKMKSRGLAFSLPNINTSSITFSPDIKNNRILYGLKGLSRIGNQLIKDIISNRPYSSIEDFLTKVKVNKPQMINLIKAGTFDELYPDKTRYEVMDLYIDLIADKKKRITLQNMMMLIRFDLIPQELDYERRLFNFNKYLKGFKSEDDYLLDTIAMNFFENNYDTSLLKEILVDDEGKTGVISQKTWDNIYKKGMNPMRDWIKANHDEILNTLNQKLLNEAAEKYTEGNISKWEMDSLSFYYHDHELENLRKDLYGISDYSKLPKEPEIDRSFLTKDGSNITMYKITRIAGTVIDKNKDKGLITLLTTDGVVSVKIWKNQFAAWDKQISERDSEGKKHVIEKSWFTRGTKLIISGVKREDSFIPKKYKSSGYPLFEKIMEIDDKGFIISSVTERAENE